MSTANGQSTIGYLIADLSRLFGRVFDRRAAHLGLTRVQWRALKRIHQSEGITQSALADLLDMEPIAVGRVLDRLQKTSLGQNLQGRVFLSTHQAFESVHQNASTPMPGSEKQVAPSA